jgi:hypothetical protein
LLSHLSIPSLARLSEKRHAHDARGWHVLDGQPDLADMEHLIVLAKERFQDSTIPDMLLDQAEFASQQGVLAEAQSLAQRALAVSGQEEMPHFQARAIKLLHQISR